MCVTHHIESRDIFRDNVVKGSIKLLEYVLKSPNVRKLHHGKIEELEKAIDESNSCIVCYYRKNFNLDLLKLVG